MVHTVHLGPFRASSHFPLSICSLLRLQVGPPPMDVGMVPKISRGVHKLALILGYEKMYIFVLYRALHMKKIYLHFCHR